MCENPETTASIKRGLEQSARGETVDLGDFTQYADEGADIEGPDDEDEPGFLGDAYNL